MKTEYNNNNNNEKNQPVLIYFKNRKYISLVPKVFSRTNHLLTKDPDERIIGKGIKCFIKKLNFQPGSFCRICKGFIFGN